MMTFESKRARVDILNLTLQLTSIHFLLSTCYNERVSSTLSKSFRRSTNRNGTDLCPSDRTEVPPYATIGVDQLDLPELTDDSGCPPPPDALCSWKCTLEPNCSSYVWRANSNLCEFYFDVPQTCAEVDDCIYFQSDIGLCGQSSCGSEIMSITGDNVIRHLYIDGCELTNLPHRNEWEATDDVTLPLTSALIAVEIYNDPGDVGGLLASTDTMRTECTWKVSTNYTSGWMEVDFDDSAWKNATTYGYNGVGPWNTRSGISHSAEWISSEDNRDRTVYFRYHLKRGDV